MRRRPPPEVDPDRLRSLLASARPRPEPSGPSGWVPEEAPPAPAPTQQAWDEPGWEEPGWEEPGWKESDWDEELLDEHGGRAVGDGTRRAGGERAGPVHRPRGGPVGDDSPEDEPGGSGRHRPPPRVLTLPVALRGARVAVSVRAVIAFLVLLAVAVVFFAVRVARAEEAAAPRPVPAGEGVVGRSSVPSAFASGASGPASNLSGTVAVPSSESASASPRGSPGRLVVDVVGQVAHPGVVTVPDGSRVVDVLTAAGGALPNADVQRLNLARVVADGEQLFVPRPGETPPAAVDAVGGAGSGSGSGSGSGNGPGGGSGSGSGGGSGPAAPVNLNTANLAALDTLPGVGPVLAQRILDWRSQHGRFSTVDELGEVSGIGDKLLEQIRPRVRV